MPEIELVKSAKYLVCVDHREEARTAMRLACMKAKPRGGRIDLLHIIPPADFQTLGAIADRMKEERQNEGESLLLKLCTEANEQFGVMPTPILREGPAGDEILAATLADPEIIMVFLGIAAQGSGGRGKLASWLAGQVGGKLLTPLLMVPGNLTDQQLQNLT
jgi:nucleotide-binding universal stress UspA family protein